MRGAGRAAERGQRGSQRLPVDAVPPEIFARALERRVAGVLQRAIAQARAASPVSAISENWKKCVPAKFAAKSSPVNVRAGVLYVAADNPQIRQELQFAARGMLKKIRGLEGCSSIKSIRFI